MDHCQNQILNPFEKMPRSVALSRAFILSSILTLLFFLGMQVFGFLPSTSWQTLYSDLSLNLYEPPQACRAVENLTVFQKQQCGNYTKNTLYQMAYAYSPLMFFILTGLSVRSFILRTYRSIQEKLRYSEALAVGTPKRELEGLSVFGWLLGLRKYEVHFSKEEKEVIYFPRSQPQLMPHERVRVFSLGKMFGRERKVAALYAPHLRVKG
jgi:hypothetical protein